MLLTNGGAEAIALVGADLGRAAVAGPASSRSTPGISPRRSIPPSDPAAPRIRSNPNNPTGRLAEPGDTAAVWDEAFYPLADRRLVPGRRRRRTGGRGHRLAHQGVRLPRPAGRATSHADPAVIDRLAGRQPRWALNGLAAALVPDLLARADLPAWAAATARRRAALAGGHPRRRTVRRQLRPRRGATDGAAAARARLARHGVLVRDCTSFGLPGHVRVAVPDEAGLARLVAAWEQDGAAVRGLRGALMVCGTTATRARAGSSPGCAGALARRGVRVAPFKAQNMALNSFVTRAGTRSAGRRASRPWPPASTPRST